jgi:hypothetical protein
VEKLLTWIAGSGATLKRSAEYFFRPTSRPSGRADETGTESAGAEDKAIATSEVEIGQEATEVNIAPANNQQDVQRRQELVRSLFNDYWKGRDDKPVTFVDRLNGAETYINEQLTARGEPWQLDANTRKMLRLPPRTT